MVDGTGIVGTGIVGRTVVGASVVGAGIVVTGVVVTAVVGSVGVSSVFAVAGQMCSGTGVGGKRNRAVIVRRSCGSKSTSGGWM